MVLYSKQNTTRAPLAAAKPSKLRYEKRVCYQFLLRCKAKYYKSASRGRPQIFLNCAIKKESKIIFLIIWLFTNWCEMQLVKIWQHSQLYLSENYQNLIWKYTFLFWSYQMINSSHHKESVWYSYLFLKSIGLSFFFRFSVGLPKWIQVERDVECTLMINLRRINRLARDEKAFAPK